MSRGKHAKPLMTMRRLGGILVDLSIYIAFYAAIFIAWWVGNG